MLGMDSATYRTHPEGSAAAIEAEDVYKLYRTVRQHFAGPEDRLHQRYQRHLALYRASFPAERTAGFEAWMEQRYERELDRGYARQHTKLLYELEDGSREFDYDPFEAA